MNHLIQRTLVAIPATLVISAVCVEAAFAQIDYRNLDEGRPVRTEDAYPVERHSFELVVPYIYENERGPGRSHLVAPELAYGIAANTMVGLKLPFTALDGGAGVDTRWGFGGPRFFGLYNFNTESPKLPAFALRADASIPFGNLAGDHVSGALSAIATRSWGRTRAHINATVGLGPEPAVSEALPVHAMPSWGAGAALDRTFLRSSLVVIAELTLREAIGETITEVSAGLGARMQLTPTLVLDAGLERRLTREAGTDIGLTIGLTHAFALAGLMPAGPR
ncbi:MAG TPA: hypothetical protein VFT04_11005 [Gemmatimonadales bacterium]|nr:hypothetical protein [Gemmatimonadales bacterium]